MRYDRFLPKPEDFTVEHLKQANMTSWVSLALITAGYRASDFLPEPDAEDRARAALVLDKALDLAQAEVVDHIRSILGNDMRGIPLYRTREEWIESVRVTALATIEEISHPDFVENKTKQIVGEEVVDDLKSARMMGKFQGAITSATVNKLVVEDARRLCQGTVFAADVLKLYREDPDAPIPAGEVARLQREAGIR